MRVNMKPALCRLALTLALCSGAMVPQAAKAAKAAHVVPTAHAPKAAVQPAAEAQAPDAIASVPAASHAARGLEHDVPPKKADEDDEVPIDWVVRDGRNLRRPQVLSLDVGIWPDSLSFGAFWASPVLPRGFIRHVNDSFDLEFGFLLAAMRSEWVWNRGDASTSWQLWPAFGARWNFFLTHAWSTFITFKVAGRIGLSGPSPGWFDVFAGAGATYRIKERMHLRLELNYPQGAVVGLSFPIGAL